MTLQLSEQPTQEPQERGVTFYGVIMAPVSPEHEDSKSTIGLLLEAYLREKGIRFYVRGGSTLGSRAVGARGEPDESYNIVTKKDVPDIAIEVVIISGGVNKLEKYRRWRVPEMWFWEKGKLSVYHLREQEYEEIARSEFVLELDLALLVAKANMSDQYDAVNEFTKIICNS